MILLAGCGVAGEASGTIPRERFIAANVALRKIEPASADAAARRREALRELGVTEADLREWVTVNRRDTEGLAETWEEIAERIEQADSGGASTDSTVESEENR